MIVKNTGKKVIGFGKTFIVPDETAPLPAGYDEKHPTVKFYLAKGWLEKVDLKDYKPEEPKVDKPPNETDEEKAARLAKEAEAAKEAAEKAAADAKEAEKAAKIKALNNMNLDPLKELAKSLEIEVIETGADRDTIATLKVKITDKYNAE